MKKAISLVLPLCMILSLAACGQRTDDNASTPDNTGTAEKTVITGSISHSSAPDSTYDIGAHYFADLVKEYTDGTVILEIYPSAQLGSDKEAFEGHRMGSVDFSMPGASMLSQYKENIAVSICRSSSPAVKMPIRYLTANWPMRFIPPPKRSA